MHNLMPKGKRAHKVHQTITKLSLLLKLSKSVSVLKSLGNEFHSRI